MEEIDHIGIVGEGPLGDQLATLAEVGGYGVHRLGFENDEARVRRLGEIPYRLRALCICAPGPPGLFRAVAEYLRLSGEHRPACLLNMTAVGPAHARRIDALIHRLDPATTFAEVAFSGGVRAVRKREAVVFYGSRSGSPGELIEKLLLGFAVRLVEFQSVTEASAAKLVNDVASTLAGLAAREAFAIGRQGGISKENLTRVLSPGALDVLAPSALASLGGEGRDSLNRLSRDEVSLLLTRASERGLQDFYVALLGESLEGSAHVAAAG